MKYLGVDFGTKRVGVAISDDAGEFAFPKDILDTKDAIAKIASIAKAEQAEAVVIGESIAANEQENEIHGLVERFKEKLGAETGLAIYFEREDFSSVEAHRYQVASGRRDDSAAAIILQRFLDKRKK